MSKYDLFARTPSRTGYLKILERNLRHRENGGLNEAGLLLVNRAILSAYQECIDRQELAGEAAALLEEYREYRMARRGQ